jgi:polysaccharide export outer membrane protein
VNGQKIVKPIKDTRKTVYFFLLCILISFPTTVNGDDYIVGEGDTLRISVWGSEELSLFVKVRPDGKITVPALGDVLAAGLSPAELTSILTQDLKSLVKNPIVSVIVEEINNNKVYIFGGGVNPRVFSLDGRTTLLQLLCLIEGVKNADLHRAYILREGEKVKEDFHRLFISGNTEEDLLIKAHDIIFIPTFEDNKIYVLGAVNNPGFVEYKEGIRVMEAILTAGGFTDFAKENDTVIFRKNGNKEIKIPIKLKDLIEDGDLNQNIELHPGDYIIIEEGIF